jgi:hypothetical protein
MSRNSIKVLAVSGCAGWGAVIWFASSYITGKEEPWDARGLVYPLSLFISGFIGAALIPCRFWLAAAAVWAGQTVGFLWRVFTSADAGGLWPLGLVIALPMYSLLSLIGASLGGLTGILIARFLDRTRKRQPATGANGASRRRSLDH